MAFNAWKNEAKNVWQSTQKTRTEVIVHSEVIEKLYRIIVQYLHKNWESST